MYNPELRKDFIDFMLDNFDEAKPYQLGEAKEIKNEEFKSIVLNLLYKEEEERNNLNLL